jgi:hypothetical protein
MNAVMPAKAGIHDLTIYLQFAKEKSWMPACAGMTLKVSRVTSKAIWYKSLFLRAAAPPSPRAIPEDLGDESSPRSSGIRGDGLHCALLILRSLTASGCHYGETGMFRHP